jgi:hypothetical protein
MMDAASTSEMLVNFYQTTWCNIPEDSLLHTCHSENLKSHKIYELVCLQFKVHGGEKKDSREGMLVEKWRSGSNSTISPNNWK